MLGSEKALLQPPNEHTASSHLAEHELLWTQRSSATQLTPPSTLTLIAPRRPPAILKAIYIRRMGSGLHQHENQSGQDRT
jgi:hypothetical protein